MDLKLIGNQKTGREHRHGADFCTLKGEKGGDLATIHNPANLGQYDPAFYARLFQKSKELLEFAIDNENGDFSTSDFNRLNRHSLVKRKQPTQHVTPLQINPN